MTYCIPMENGSLLTSTQTNNLDPSLYLRHTKYRGYIVFVFSVTMFVCLSVCVCLCVNFFSAKDFSGTTAPRILKFTTNIGYDLLNWVRQNQHPYTYYSLYLSFFFLFFLSSIFFVKDFSGTTAPRIWKFYTNIGYDLLYCIRGNQHPHAYHFLYLSIFSFSPIFFCHRFCSSYEN